MRHGTDWQLGDDNRCGVGAYSWLGMEHKLHVKEFILKLESGS
jgi:hypothetical protein